MKKNLIFYSIVAVILIYAVASFYHIFQSKKQSLGASFISSPSFISASSTVFTLTTTSQRLLGTSTPTKRLAATIQPINCTIGTGAVVFVKMNSDVVATSNNGFAVLSSTTQSFGDYPEAVPIVQGAVQGIVPFGTCTVMVTEWRSQY